MYLQLQLQAAAIAVSAAADSDRGPSKAALCAEICVRLTCSLVCTEGSGLLLEHKVKQDSVGQAQGENVAVLR